MVEFFRTDLAYGVNLADLSYPIFKRKISSRKGGIDIVAKNYYVSGKVDLTPLNEILKKLYNAEVDGVIINDKSYNKSIITTGRILTSYSETNNVTLLHISSNTFNKRDFELLDKLRNYIYSGVGYNYMVKKLYRIEHIHPDSNSKLSIYENTIVSYYPISIAGVDLEYIVKDVPLFIPGLFIPD